MWTLLLAASLPLLFPEQQEDVLKAERRFFTERPVEARGATAEGLGDPKRGILFTNGTGTGKVAQPPESPRRKPKLKPQITGPSLFGDNDETPF